MKKPKKHICNSCKNKLHFEYYEKPEFEKDGTQIKGKELLHYKNNECIYNRGIKYSVRISDDMIIVKCNFYKK